MLLGDRMDGAETFRVRHGSDGTATLHLTFALMIWQQREA